MNQKRSTFLAACRCEEVEYVPIWFMRQAGRSLPEYRELRERHSLLEICRTPDLAAEATLQPVRRLGVDAAILFSDIMVPLQAVGVDLEIVEGVGPVIAEPIRTASDARILRPLDPQADVPFVLETISSLVGGLDVPLIGFSGAPYTLACYLVEGGPSRDRARARTLMHADPESWNALMEALTQIVTAYLRAQLDAGAGAVQVFDSWVGDLSAEDYRRHVAPYTERILAETRSDAPRIIFGVGTEELLPLMASHGAEVVGVDWRVPLDDARRRVGDSVALQGNLDPAICLAPWNVLRDRALDVLTRGGGRGHVFNLGHGVQPETDPDVLKRLVDLVHGWEPPQ